MARVAHDGEPDGETPAVFGVEGERILTEATLEHMEGFAGSQPVRIGNAAWEQRQLDVYGHIMAAAGSYDSAAEFDPVVQRFLCQVATRAARGWQSPSSSPLDEDGNANTRPLDLTFLTDGSTSRVRRQSKRTRLPVRKVSARTVWSSARSFFCA